MPNTHGGNSCSFLQCDYYYFFNIREGYNFWRVRAGSCVGIHHFTKSKLRFKQFHKFFFFHQIDFFLNKIKLSICIFYSPNLCHPFPWPNLGQSGRRRRWWILSGGSRAVGMESHPFSCWARAEPAMGMGFIRPTPTGG